MTLTPNLIDHASRGFANRVNCYIRGTGRCVTYNEETCIWQEHCSTPSEYTWTNEFTAAAIAAADKFEAEVRAAMATRRDAPAQAIGPSQLWEPCEECGAEPSYDVGRHLCARCAKLDHPKIDTREPWHSTEPHNWVGGL